MLHVDPASLAADPAPAGASADPRLPRPLVERQLAMLTRLAEMGMAIAEAATAAATAAPADAPAGEAPFRGDPALAYTRVARAVRLTLALQTQLLKDLAALEAGETAARAKGRERVAEVVRRGVMDAHAEAGWRHQADLAHYARECLKDAEDDADLLGLPFAEAVAQICRDLDLPADWTARAIAAAAALGSPPDLSGGGPAESREGGEGAVTAGSPAPAAPSTAFRGPPPPQIAGEDQDEEDTFLEWPPPAPT